MSASLLYHGFGVCDYRYMRTRYEDGAVIFVMERKPETCRRTACGSANMWGQSRVVRRFRTVPLGTTKRVYLEARISRLACQDCGAVRQAAVGFGRAISGSPDHHWPAQPRAAFNRFSQAIATISMIVRHRRQESAKS